MHCRLYNSQHNDVCSSVVLFTLLLMSPSVVEEDERRQKSMVNGGGPLMCMSEVVSLKPIVGSGCLSSSSCASAVVVPVPGALTLTSVAETGEGVGDGGVGDKLGVGISMYVTEGRANTDNGSIFPMSGNATLDAAGFKPALAMTVAVGTGLLEVVARTLEPEKVDSDSTDSDIDDDGNGDAEDEADGDKDGEGAGGDTDDDGNGDVDGEEDGNGDEDKGGEGAGGETDNDGTPEGEAEADAVGDGATALLSKLSTTLPPSLLPLLLVLVPLPSVVVPVISDGGGCTEYALSTPRATGPAIANPDRQLA